MKRNILYLSALVFVLSLQVLIILAFIYQFIPLKAAAITEDVPASLLKVFQPNRNYFFYHAFIAAAIIGEMLALYLYRKRLEHADVAGEVRDFLLCETVWVSWQLFAVFKVLQYNNPGWAEVLLYAGFAAALLAKIFWPELKRGLAFLKDYLRREIPVSWRKFADAGIIFILLAVIAVPNGEKALLRMALADGNDHFDQWLMAPLWAYHKGLIPALQFFNPLNWGVPVLVHALVSLMGSVTCAHVIAVLCLLAIVYYAVFYYLLRSWLGTLTAIFGVLLAVKLQMFNIGVNPLIWAFPAQSMLRHLFDVAVFFCLLFYAQGRGELFLWLAAAAVGISLSFVFDTGVYLLVALYAYVAALMSFKDTRCSLCPTPRQWRKVLGLAFLPWLVMIAALFFCIGPAVLHRAFWMESFKDVPRWLAGADSISVYSCLRDRNFFAFFASFFPPLLYAAGMAATVSMVYFRSWKSEKLFLVPLSVYGLGVYAHFLWHASINYYYMAPLPLVGCVCFWMTQYLDGFKNAQRRLVKLILALLTLIGLFTNVIFTYYPNVFNMAGQVWDRQMAYYQANFNFKNDADLIRQATSPDERVALISGFEIQVLLQADRAPLFNNSLALMDQLDKAKPRQVFVNKSILNMANNPAISALTDYLKAHYQYTGKQSDNLALLEKTHE